MNEKQFYGFTGKRNGKEERYARIFRTKIGNEYLILMEEDRIHYHCVPLEDLKRFCETYPLSDVREAEKNHQNLERLFTAMKDYLKKDK